MKIEMLLALVATAAVANGQIILDDFDADPNDDAGGPRVLSSTVINNPFNQPSQFYLDTGVNFGGDIGAVVLNSGIGNLTEAKITWDNGGAGLGLDLVALGITSFELDFLAADLDFKLDFLSSSSGGSASVRKSITAGGFQTLSITLAELAISGSFDASNVDSVVLTFNVQDDGTPSLDFVLGEFRAIPTPGALALTGVGLLAAARRRR
jgi:hypothetical protein